jgi:hypothetical protein
MVRDVDALQVLRSPPEGGQGFLDATRAATQAGVHERKAIVALKEQDRDRVRKTDRVDPMYPRRDRLRRSSFRHEDPPVPLVGP